jgi:RNase H-fold protein (predicted Holliday junction resolvase)
VCDGDDGKRLGIAYGDINIHMVGAIQELKKQNDAQQKEIDELKELVRQLIVRVEKA